MISLNITLVFQAVIFLTIMILLNQLLFKPMIRILEERRARTEGRKKAAAQAEAEAEAIWAEYQKRIQDAKLEADRMRTEIVRHGEAERQRVLDAASEKAEKAVTEVRARVRAEAQEARRALESEASSLAGSIASAVLGRNV